MHKIWVALNKEKSLASFRHWVTMWTIRTMIWLHPIPFKFSVPKCNYHRRTSLLKPVWRFVSLFQRNRKSTRHSHSGLKSKISERMLFQTMLHSPMLKICVALNKEKGSTSFKHRVTIKTMIWFFHIADFCIWLLVIPNNRDFTRSNRVYVESYWFYICGGLS